jgi:colanic acid/amylovoran biosynthesis glycosyltransferase
VHHLGVDCRRFAFVPRRQESGGPFHVVTIARFVEKKGIEYGVRAIGAMLEAGQDVRLRARA